MPVARPLPPASGSLAPAATSSVPLGLLVLVFVLLAARVFLAGFGLPILLGDALFFIPTAMQELLYGELSNPHLSPIQSGGGPYVWHGWLYPMALSTLAYVSQAGTTAAIQVIDALLVLAAGVLFVLKLGRAEGAGWLKCAVAVCACGFLASATGRPEVMAQLLLVIWLVAWEPPEPGRLDVTTAVILGLIAVAQPTVAMLAAAFYATWLAHARDLRGFAAGIAAVGVVSLALAGTLTVIFFPWSLSDLLHGLIEQARSLSLRHDGDFIGTYFKNVGMPLLIVWPALALLGLAAVLARGGKASTVLFYPLAAMSAWLVWRSGMRISYTAYNLVVFLPLLAFGLMRLASGAKPAAPVGAVLRLALPALAVLMLVAQARALAVTALSWQRGVPAAELVQSLKDDLRQGRRVAVTLNLAMADYPLSRSRALVVMPLADAKFAADADVMYLHQAFTGRQQPAELPGWTLQDNRFMPSVRLLGVPLANTPVSFEYARYVRSGPATR